MSDDGTSFTIDLPVKGQAEVDRASAAVDVLAVRLDEASKAYQSAESKADRAAKAVERVGLAADVQRAKLRAASDANDSGAAEKVAAKLRDLVVEQGELAEYAKKSKTALEGEAAALDKLQLAAKKAKDEEVKRTEAEKKPKAEGREEGINFEGVSRGLGKLGGPLAEAGRSVAELGAGFGKLTKSLGAAGPYVAMAVLVVALAAAFIAAAAAAVVATIKIAAWAVGLADANRNVELLAAGTARSVKGGAELSDKIGELTKKLPLTREELTSTAQRLADAGLRGKSLADALQRTAIAAAKLKFGPEFAKEMLSLDEQSKVFHANLEGIFGGLKIEGLLTALQKIVGLFDEDSASGRAMKVVFESIFQPLVDGLTNAEPKIEAFFLQLEIWALKALIFFKPHASLVLKIGEAFAIVAAVVGVLLVTAVGLVIAVLATPLVLFAQLVFAVIQFKDKFLEAFNAVKTWLYNFNLADVGKAMMAGLVNGITNGGAAVLSAMKGAVTGAVDAAEKALGIASPSKVFAEIGMQTGAGMALGVDRSSSGVQSSLENMVSAPSASGAGAAASPGAAAAGSNSGSISLTGPFFFYGVEGAEDAESRMAAMLTRLLEGDAAQIGAAAPT